MNTYLTILWQVKYNHEYLADRHTRRCRINNVKQFPGGTKTHKMFGFNGNLSRPYLSPYAPGTIAVPVCLLHRKFLENDTKNWRPFAPYHIKRRCKSQVKVTTFCKLFSHVLQVQHRCPPQFMAELSDKQNKHELRVHKLLHVIESCNCQPQDGRKFIYGGTSMLDDGFVGLC